MPAQLLDIHHHIIFSVDDGPQTFEQTQAMLVRAHENGVGVICCTSHSIPARKPFPMEDYLAHLALAQEWCDAQGLYLHLCPGAEIYYAKDAVQHLREGKIPTLNNAGAVLVEFSTEAKYDTIREAVRNLGNSGFPVMLAHIERYSALRKLERVEELHEDLGAFIQINAGTFLSPHGFFEKRWLRKVMENGLCDIAATDAHNTDSRPCRLRKCYDLLASEWGRETADKLCIENPARLLNLNI